MLVFISGKFRKNLASLSRQFAAAIAPSSSRNRSQLFIPTHNETLPVAAMCVSIQIVSPSESTAETAFPTPPVLRIVDHLRRRFARFKLALTFWI